MDCKIGALLIISTQLFATLAASSPCACTRELRPVCGSNGETYNNPCLLRCAAHTSGKEIDVIKSIPCDEEPSLEEPSLEEQNNCICTFNYSPVCGSDGQTYSNECGLNCHRARFNNALKVNYTGSCRTPRQSPCICTLEYNPVCGSNGRTYGNRCGLNCEMKKNKRLRFAHKGPCAGTVKGL